MTIFENYLEREIDALEGAQSGASDLSAYEGESISLTASADNIVLETTATDSSAVLRSSGAALLTQVTAQGTGGEVSIVGNTYVSIGAGEDVEDGAVNISASGTGGAVNISVGDGAVNIGAAGGDSTLAISSSVVVTVVDGSIDLVATTGDVNITADEVAFTLANPPELPAIPTAQDIVDMLVVIGLVTQAAP